MKSKSRALSFLLAISILSAGFTFPTSTKAQFPYTETLPPIPTADHALRGKEAGITIFGYTVPGITWDAIGMMIIRPLLEEILHATTDWVRSGFEGNPAYATDPERFLTGVADNIAGEFIMGSDLNFLCSPFQTRIRLSLLDSYSRRPSYECSLTEVVGNIEGFYNDFSQGGWDGWFSMTQNSSNNPYGAYMDAKIELDSRIAEALGIQKEQLSWNKGFLSWSECVRNDPETGECVERGPVQTPGIVMESQLENVFGSGVRQLELADEFDELVNALFSQLLQQTIFSSNGLFSSGGRSTAPRLVNNPIDIDGDGIADGADTTGNGQINICYYNQNGSSNPPCTGSTGTRVGSTVPVTAGQAVNLDRDNDGQMDGTDTDGDGDLDICFFGGTSGTANPPCTLSGGGVDTASADLDTDGDNIPDGTDTNGDGVLDTCYFGGFGGAAGPPCMPSSIVLSGIL